MPLSLRFDPKYLDGDIADIEDDAALTEATIALATDARIDPSLVPAGKSNWGYWADALLSPGEQTGSTLWRYDDRMPTVELGAELERDAQAALAPIVREERIIAADTDVLIDGTHLDVVARLTLPSGAVASLGPIRVS